MLYEHYNHLNDCNIYGTNYDLTLLIILHNDHKSAKLSMKNNSLCIRKPF